jgi:hypothetical protein
MPNRDPALYAALRDFKARNGFTLIRRHGAHAVGIGRKVVQGRRTDQLALRFYVDRKLTERTAGGLAIPRELTVISPRTGRVTRLVTDIIETPRMHFEVDPETKIRPVPGGVSFGRNGSTGTLGGWCWDLTDDTIVALSNEHVLGTTGGLATIQQGSADGGTIADNRMGTTKRGIVRNPPPAVNQVDCAIADVDDSDDIDSSVLEIGPAIYAIADATDGLAVEKYGQTTQHTYGEVTDVDWAGTVSGLDFDDCLYIEPIDPSDDWSNSGDSGSAVFSQTIVTGTIKPVVGLHFAGGGANGVACKIGSVFNELDLTTLCAGLFAAVFEAMFDDEAESEAEGERLGAIAGRLARPRLTRRDLSFVARERRHLRPRGGLARAVQARLAASPRGKALVDAIDRHRPRLLELVVHDADVRRTMTRALRPIVRGAATVDDVLRRPLSADDVGRLSRLAQLVADRAGGDLAAVVQQLAPLAGSAAGHTLGQVFGVQ